MTKKISLEKKKKRSIEDAIKKLIKSGKLQPLKTDQVCYNDYAVPGKYRFKNKE